MEDLIPSISVDALLAARDQAQEAYLGAKNLLDKAADRLTPFGVGLPRLMVEFPGSTYRDVRHEDYRTPIENEIDRHFWVQLFALTHIDTVMDHRTRRDLFDRLHKSRAYMADQEDALPPLTKENIEATFAGVRDNQLEYFERGVEATYRALSWHHRTNEPGRIGDKLIITGAFYDTRREWQGDSVSLNHHEALHDLERVLCILDGQAPPAHGVGIRSLGKLPWGKWVDVPGTSGESIIKIKCFRKGTTHIRISKQELVDEMNRIMAYRFPGAIPEPRKSKTRRENMQARRPRPSTALAKSYKDARQAFYTPEDLATQLVEAAQVGTHTEVLEPSAGEGSIVRAALNRRCEHVTAIENDPHGVELLGYLAERVRSRHEHEALKVKGADFFDVRPNPVYDAVVMNPPFANAQEVEHVLHAWEFVKPGGRLVSVMSNGVLWRTTGRYGAFASFLKENDAKVTKLPSGSFSESGTDVETVMVVVQKEDKPCS